MITKGFSSWPLILADFALVLFLLVLSSVTVSETNLASPSAHIAPSQALYRPVDGAPPIAQWITQQPFDERATLTVFAFHKADQPKSAEAAWKAANALTQEAHETGIATRIVIRKSEYNDLYASLAFDEADSSYTMPLDMPMYSASSPSAE